MEVIRSGSSVKCTKYHKNIFVIKNIFRYFFISIQGSRCYPISSYKMGWEKFIGKFDKTFWSLSRMKTHKINIAEITYRMKKIKKKDSKALETRSISNFIKIKFMSSNFQLSGKLVSVGSIYFYTIYFIIKITKKCYAF